MEQGSGEVRERQTVTWQELIEMLKKDKGRIIELELAGEGEDESKRFL